jgi:nitrite reductase/ring-hydroxylating ferredoxin subunit
VDGRPAIVRGPTRDLPLPSGWFALAAARELDGGAVVVRRVGETERVLFRDGSGRAAAANPHCPHLGAHLGGGRIDGGALRCPFHGLRFDADGVCVSTPGGTRPPRRARLAVHPVVESGGWVFSWFDPTGAAPGWSPPVLAADRTLRTHAVELRTHPQETTENSVDLAHFAEVHGYRDVRLHGISVDGPHLHTRYGFVRPAGFAGLARDVVVDIDVHVWGLGFSYVDVVLPQLGVETRQFVLPTAVGHGRTELRLGMAVGRRSDAILAVRWMPRWLFDGVVGATAMRGYVGDVMADRSVWENKLFLPRPALTAEDGPIAHYRAWVRQFYPS